MTHETASIDQSAGESVATSVILDNFVGEDELLADLIAAFRGHAPLLLADIRRGLETQDMGLVQRAAHTLKGSMGIFGTTTAYVAARALEAAARSGARDRAAAALEPVQLGCDRLDAAFEQILRTGNGHDEHPCG